MECLPLSYINYNLELIIYKDTNEWCSLKGVETEFDLKCKIIESFSRGAYKSEPWRNKKKNEAFHSYLLNGINEYLGTSFTYADMEIIYTYLGNGVNHERTRLFVLSGYDMNVFKNNMAAVDKPHQMTQEERESFFEEG